MPPKKRKAAVFPDDEDQPSSSSSNAHKRKLRCDKQLSSVCDTVADKHQPSSYNANKRKLNDYKLQSSPSAATIAQQRIPPEVAKMNAQLQQYDEDENSKYTFLSPHPQCFSFPAKLIYYMAKNPSSVKCHQMLLQTCKLFPCMSKILPVASCACVRNSLFARIWVSSIVKSRSRYSIARINLKKLLFCKLWFFDRIVVDANPLPNFVSTLVQRIHICSLKVLSIHDQVLTFNELRFLASGAQLENVHFIENIIKNDDGNVTEFEKVFEVLYCKSMDITFHCVEHGIGEKTSAKMTEIWDAQTERHRFEILNIPENFDLRPFFANLHGRKHTLNFIFAHRISTEYLDQLEEFAKEFAELPVDDKLAVPVIGYLEVENEKYKFMLMRP